MSRREDYADAECALRDLLERIGAEEVSVRYDGEGYDLTSRGVTGGGITLLDAADDLIEGLRRKGAA